MKVEILDKWIAALRSGEYKQHRGNLVKYDDTTPVAFCCLGVLSEIENLIDEPSERITYPPIQWFHSWCIYDRLQRMNEGTVGYQLHSFSEIADFLEENREKLIGKEEFTHSRWF